MSWEQIGQGSVLDAYDIGSVVSQAQPNTYVRLTFDLKASPAGWMITQIQNALNDAGYSEVTVSSASPNISFTWLNEATTVSEKVIAQIDPLTLIAIILASLAVIAIVVIGWRVLNDIPSSVLSNPWLWGLVAFGGIAILSGVAYSKFKQPQAAGG